MTTTPTTNPVIPTYNEARSIANLGVSSTMWYAHLTFGSYSTKEVLLEVAFPNWQRVRVSMLLKPDEFKWNTLRQYLIDNNFSQHAKVCVTNYVYALARGGIIR
jgi:hypothetical protein